MKTQSLNENQTPAEKRASMTWAERLKRVFDIDIETCSECGGETGFSGKRLVEFREVTYRNGKTASLERQVGRRAFHGKGCLFYLYSANRDKGAS